MIPCVLYWYERIIIVLNSCVVLGDRGEESFFDLSGEVINEMAPQPHLVAGSGTTSLTATATSSNTNSNRGTGGAFPQLDSNLLQV